MAEFGKHIDPEVGKATQFPHNDPTKGGRPKTRPLRDMIESIEEDDFTVTIPIQNCVVYDDVVVVKMQKKQFIAQSLLNKAAKDVRWFREWAKVMGEYAPTKNEHTGKDGEPIQVKHITGMEIK